MSLRDTINYEKAKWCQAGTQGRQAGLQNRCRAAVLSWSASGFTFVVTDASFIDSNQEIADFFFVDHKPSSDNWFIPTDSAALTPEPRLGKLS
jgi:hypothetical protein